MTTEPGTQPSSAHIELAAVPTAPAVARSFVRHTLRTWSLDELADNAELIASELVTNAVKATGVAGPEPSCLDLRDLALVVMRLRVHDGALRIAVQDSSHEQPRPQAAGDDAEGGRGLFLVEALSTRWDVRPTQDGKVTWADLALTSGVSRAGLVS